MSNIPKPLALAGIDVRALATLRVGLGCMLLWDQATALSNVRIFYSDEGILPRVSLLQSALENPFVWSFHLMGGSVVFQSLLIAVAMLAALALVVGWRTRWATFVSWVLLCSIQARNPGVLYGGDVVLRMMCFWGMFLPLGARASVDAKLAPEVQNGPSIWLSMASLAALLQVAFIYWFTAILKSGNEWTRDGSALYYVFSADQFVQGLGRVLLGWPEVCRWLSFGTWWLELLGPFVAFLPLGTRWFRLAVVVAMWTLHLGIFLTMRLGMFPWMMMLVWVPYLPSMFWDWLEGPRADQNQSRTSGPWDLMKLPGIVISAVAMRFRTGLINPLAGWLIRGSSPLTKWQAHWLTQSFVAVCLTSVFIWCLGSVQAPRFASLMPQWARPFVHTLRLDQYWGLFAPTPIKNDGWLVLEAELYDHTRIDVLRHGQALSFAKPRSVSAEYPDWKWQKLEANLAEDSGKIYRASFGDYLCRKWSQTQSEPSKKVRSWVLYNMLEVTLPHYYAITPQQQELARNDLFTEP